jgi:hypothetical protein
MRFRLVHKLVSYLLVATAVATLVAPGVVPPLSLAMLAVAGVFSWFVEPEGRLGQALARLTWLFNLITLVMVAFAILQVARSFPEIDLTPFLNFVLFLLAYKLCQRRSNRDYLQLYILSFLIILAAAWQATSAAFMLGFALYVILATWTLLLFHLRREIEENYLVRHAEGASSERVTMGRVRGPGRRGTGLRHGSARWHRLPPGRHAPSDRRGGVQRSGQAGLARRALDGQPDRRVARAGSTPDRPVPTRARGPNRVAVLARNGLRHLRQRPVDSIAG